jgi:hypothetical protein
LQQEASLNAKLAKVETDAQEKLEQKVKDGKTEVQTFLTNVYQLFTPYVQTAVPLTFQGIDGMLRKVKGELDRQPTLVRAKGQLEEIRSLLNGATEILPEVVRLTKLTDQRNEIARLRDEVDALTIWIERIFALYGRSEVDGDVDLPAMKTAIESLLQRTTRDAKRRGREPYKSRRTFPGFIFDEDP